MYVIIAADGGRLSSYASGVWLSRPGQTPRNASTSFALEPVEAEPAELGDGVLVRVRSTEGRWLARAGGDITFSSRQSLALVWRVERIAGPGRLALGESFRLRSVHGRLYLHGSQRSVTLTPWPTPPTAWSLGCYFSTGPYRARWQDEPTFAVVTSNRAAQVANAIEWLRANTFEVELPSGSYPLIVWDDPTLAPEPTVAYLMIDTLWAAKALQPYVPDLAEKMEHGLRSTGWYGNGLADTLFHGYAEPAHRPSSDDVVHGTLLGRCISRPRDDDGPRSAQVRVPEQAVDPAWTAGNSAQFIDSAVYTALNDHWNGRIQDARARLRELLVQTGDGDVMFWDVERGLMVDQASRCAYDSFVGRCSVHCESCAVCTEGCVYFNAAYKLGLVLYAARVLGLDADASLATPLAQIEYRLWEGQLEDGGVPHWMFYVVPGIYFLSSGATGEATAIAVLANTVVVPAAQD